MAARRRIRKILAWGTTLCFCIVVGGGIFAYTYVTDNENLRTIIRDGAPKFLPTSQLEVSRVRVRPVAGEIILHNLAIRQSEGGIPKFVGMSPYVRVSYDPWASLDGRFDLKEVAVSQPKLRLRRRLDGTWNFEGLLASPWPLPPSESTPPVQIENGTVELVDEADGPDATPIAILRDVSVRVTSGDLHGTPIRFTGTCNGDLYDHLKIEGSFDRSTGKVTLKGALNRLTISKTLLDRLPVEIRSVAVQLGLVSGETDVTLNELTYDPQMSDPLHYEGLVRLKAGVWKCEKLPFPINELDGSFVIKDGIASILNKLEGRSGATEISATGSIDFRNTLDFPFNVILEVSDLEIDRVKEWSFRTFGQTAQSIWSDFKPKGRIDLNIDLKKAKAFDSIGWNLAVGCRDVSLKYNEFAYPVEHVSGELICSPDLITVDLHTKIGDKRASAKGRIENPGPGSTIDLQFVAESLPINKALLDAMPSDVRETINSFKPSGTVQGTASVRRTPAKDQIANPKGDILINADLDLNPGCEITWDGLKYPVRDLTGHLEIRPTSWNITKMHGTHGQATITGEGLVRRIHKDQYAFNIHVNAENILFETQLRDALQDAWRKTWDTLNPRGASDVDVTIKLEPGKKPDYYLEVTPRPETNLRLKFQRVAVEGDVEGPREIEMPMDNVSGRFVYRNGKVDLTDGSFTFRNSPVRFSSGVVEVFDSGKFSLSVKDLSVKDFRLDSGLRKLMPPVMAQYARRLDDGKSFLIRTDLALAWTGKPGEPATCGWSNATVVLNDNTIGAGVPLRHLQGQLDHLQGSYDGRNLMVRGALDLASVNVFDLPMTRITTPIEVTEGKAKLTDIKATLLDGTLTGNVEIGLEATPKFEAHLRVDGANLEQLAKNQPGKQTYRGLVSGKIDLNGLGQDMHSLQGGGEAHITEGDLGKLPTFLRVANVLNLAPTTKTAFDKADVWFKIRNGETTFNPIQFFGYAFSLHGRGTLDVQDELDIKLRVLYGRDTWHVSLVSEAFREASGQIFVIRVLGTPSAPIFRPEPLPQATEFVKSFGGDRRSLRGTREREASTKPRMFTPANP
jgi:hypothetical protein